MNKKVALATGAALLALVFVFVLLPDRSSPPEKTAASAAPEPEFQPLRANAVEEEPEPAPAETAEVEEEEPIHYNEDGMDPEDQPRAFFAQDFRPGELPSGYKLHNVRLTENGFELEPPGPGEAGKPRIGMVESPPMKLDFPSNSVAPSWIDDLPEGTSVMVEVSVSPDGENWGMWHTADVDHDAHGQINEFYPDGTPNPNYGYTPGGIFIWGPLLWTHWRYTVALYSETDDSPTFSSLRMYHQDSTMGAGRLAELNVPEEEPSSGSSRAEP